LEVELLITVQLICSTKSIHLCYFERRSRISNLSAEADLFEISIVNNFLTRSMQTKNRIVSKCANDNISIYIILNVICISNLSAKADCPRNFNYL